MVKVKLSLFLLVGLILAGLWACPAQAQDDPNAQYITIATHSWQAGETRSVRVPVEPMTLRLFFAVQSESTVQWEIIAPNGRAFDVKGPNVSVTNVNATKRVVALWDPRPGAWAVRLTGHGTATVAVSIQSDIYACCLGMANRQIQPLDRLPLPVGSQQQATAYVSGVNLAQVSYALVDGTAEPLSSLRVRQSDYSNPYNFTITFEVPTQPARILVRGRDEAGTEFQRIYPPLIFPQAQLANAEPEVRAPNPPPTNLPLAEWESGFVVGPYQIVRAKVLQYTDEPLLSPQGNPLGIRLKYSIQFPQSGSYSPLPSLYPERITSGYTGALSMRMIRSTITPLPAGVTPSAQTLYAGRIAYQSGITYEITADLVPNFVMYNEAQQQFCLATKAYQVQGMKEKFEREISSEARLRFRLNVNGSDLDGRQVTLTHNSYTPKLWYASMVKQGATECQ